jgi:uncharacterized protein (UPF0210 family)
MISIFNGYTCCASRVLVLPKFWIGSQKLIEKLEEKMRNAPAPVNYYPGTKETIIEAMACYADMQRYGESSDQKQPWMFVKNLDSSNDEYAFKREFWSAFLAQAFVEGETREEYLINSVKFANEKLWGTLAAVLIVDHKTEKDLKATKLYQKAIDSLRYGTVAINTFPGLSIFLATAPWGGYPGATYNNIQSGNCFVSNPFMLSKVEKSVIYAPFRIVPKPFWFVTNKPNIRAAKALADFAIGNKLKDFGKGLLAILRG